MADRVCLVYATWNRGPLLQRSLARLSELTVPDEIVVVDDGSVDDTEEVCARARDELGLPLRYLYNHRPHEAMCSQAKNAGLRHTNAELVVFSEPEMYFETDVIAQLVARHEVVNTSLVNAGTVYHEQPDGARCPCCNELRHVTRNWQALWTALFRRDWLMAINGWDEHFPRSWGWDDPDLGSRLRIGGVGQYNDLEIEATHQWHPTRFQDQGPNEHYFRSKGFHGDERPDHPHLIANQGGDWGVLIPR